MPMFRPTFELLYFEHPLKFLLDISWFKVITTARTWRQTQNCMKAD